MMQSLCRNRQQSNPMGRDVISVTKRRNRVQEVLMTRVSSA